MAKEEKGTKKGNEEEKEPVPEKKEKAKETSVRKKIKPKLSKKRRALLEERDDRKRVQPKFRRGEWFRYRKLGTSWRRPRGVTNKMRKNLGYRPPKVKVGYGKSAEVRGIHPSGFEEVLVHNVREMENIDPKLQAARIGSTVGTKKRAVMVAFADEKGIRVLNRGVL